MLVVVVLQVSVALHAFVSLLLLSSIISCLSLLTNCILVQHSLQCTVGGENRSHWWLRR